jgi:hypothetical protein
VSKPVRPYELSPHNADTRIVDRTDASTSDGRIICEPRRSKVAITGAGRSMRGIPWNDPEWEVWGINNFWNAMRDTEDRLRCDRWFELHPPTTDIQDPHDMEWLRSCPVPIYTTEPFPENPNAVVFPVDALASRYLDYFSCTFAYQIALALAEGFQEIGLFGLELAYGTQRETTVERACVNWWLGLASGTGVRITIPQGDFVLSHWGRYGFQYWDEAKAVEEYVGTLIGRKVAE